MLYGRYNIGFISNNFNSLVYIKLQNYKRKSSHALNLPFHNIANKELSISGNLGLHFVPQKARTVIKNWSMDK